MRAAACPAEGWLSIGDAVAESAAALLPSDWTHYCALAHQLDGPPHRQNPAPRDQSDLISAGLRRLYRLPDEKLPDHEWRRLRGQPGVPEDLKQWIGRADCEQEALGLESRFFGALLAELRAGSWEGSYRLGPILSGVWHTPGVRFDVRNGAVLPGAAPPLEGGRLRPRPPGGTADPAESAGAPRRRGRGRPPNPVWAKIDVEVMPWLTQHGLPEPGDGQLEGLKAKIAKLLVRHNTTAGASTIRGHARRIIAANKLRRQCYT